LNAFNLTDGHHMSSSLLPVQARSQALPAAQLAVLEGQLTWLIYMIGGPAEVNMQAQLSVLPTLLVTSKPQQMWW
jgi:hypothetical protein